MRNEIPSAFLKMIASRTRRFTNRKIFGLKGLRNS